MATRWCGNVKINCTLVNKPYSAGGGEQYKCTLSKGVKKLGTEYVGLPMHLSHAVDSPIAIDNAVHAAISFALDLDKISESDIDYDGDGTGTYRVLRKKPSWI